MTENEAINYLRQIDPKHIECVELIDMKDVWENIPQAIYAVEKALKEIHQYRAIGTVEECRKAMERRREKKPIKVENNGFRYTDSYICPNCEKGFTGTGIADFCYHCGQAIDFSEV